MSSSPNSVAEAAPINNQLADLEIKDTHLIFDRVWNELSAARPLQHDSFPKEIFWLNGAPGAGKGTHTATIMKYRGFTAPPLVVSDLLNSEEARKRIDAGQLVGDTEVCTLLMRRLLDPLYARGAVVDGFPRSMVQVEFLKLFYEKLNALSKEHYNQTKETYRKKTHFHILVLFVSEEVSVKRQLERGKKALAHNAECEASGIGEIVEVRATDFDPEKARNRYRVFKERTYEPLKSLRSIFHFHFINAEPGIEETQQLIIEELEYQSSLELSQATFERLSPLPLASEIVVHARQELVERLDNYELHEPDLFAQVIAVVQNKFMPIIARHAVSGHACVNTEDPIFHDDRALSMLIDIFSERGYQATVDIRKEEIPCKWDPTTHEITTRLKTVCRVSIRFPGSEIRRGR